MKTLVGALLLAFAVPTFAQDCPVLSISDAHVLTKEQLARRVCNYWGEYADAERMRHLPVQTKEDISRYDLAVAVSSQCKRAVLTAEELYEERFNERSVCEDRDMNVEFLEGRMCVWPTDKASNPASASKAIGEQSSTTEFAARNADGMQAVND